MLAADVALHNGLVVYIMILNKQELTVLLPHLVAVL